MVLLTALASASAGVFASRGASRQAIAGRYLITASVRPRYQSVVEVLGSTGRLERVLARPNLFRAVGARWSPDGSMLAWSGPDGVSVMRADGRAGLLVRAPVGCTQVCVPLTFAWSPNGRNLLVGGAGNATSKFLSVSVATEHVRRLAPPRAFTEYQAIGWSQNEIVYTRFSGNPGTASCCTLDLIAARPDGSSPRRLFRFADGGIRDVPAASTSPDGRFVAFTTEGRDPHDPRLAITDIRRGTTRAIRGVSPLTAAPAWSPDSRRIAVATVSKVAIFTLGARRSHSLDLRGVLVDWGRDGLTIVDGAQSNEVLRSSDGKRAASLVFRMPKKQSILTIDVK